MQEQDETNSGGGDRDKALRALLSRAPHEQTGWDKFKKSGASDTQIINALRSIVPKTGRTGSDYGVCCLKVKPKIAFWFGSYAAGDPTFEGTDLLRYVRDVMEIPEKNGAGGGAAADVVSEPENAEALQLALFDYSQLDEDDAIVVRAAATEIQQRMASMQFNFVEVGRRLAEVKERLGRGRFEEWLKAEFGISRDSAERWIQSAELVDQSPQIAEKVKAKQFSKSAVYLLAAPSTPASAVNEVESRLKAGQKIGHTAAKEIVERHAIAIAAEEQAPEALFPAGKCRICGCTETEPCEMDGGESCGWADETQTLCTKCEEPEAAGAQPEVVASGRTLQDLLSLLKFTPAGMQVEQLAKMDFSQVVIEKAHGDRLIDRSVKGLCSYAWTSQDVTDAIKEHGPMGLIDLEQMGCKRYAVEVAKSEGLIEQKGSKWVLAPESKARSISRKKASSAKPSAGASAAGGGTIAAKIESLLKGRILVVTYSWIPQLHGKVTVGVRVGNDPTKTKSETLPAEKVRGFPEAVQEMIANELKGPRPQPSVRTPAPKTGSGQKAAGIRKSAIKATPGAKQGRRAKTKR